MYYKLLEEAPRAKAPRVPNDSWSTMGRRKPGVVVSRWCVQLGGETEVLSGGLVMLVFVG